MNADRKLRILIVEDESLISYGYRLQLERAGYEIVATVRNANDAEQVLKDVSPDLILMDIYLKGDKTGLDLAKEIRLSNEVPIIFLTASTRPDILDEIKMLTNCKLLPKPVNSEVLEDMVRGTKKAS